MKAGTTTGGASSAETLWNNMNTGFRVSHFILNHTFLIFLSLNVSVVLGHLDVTIGFYPSADNSFPLHV